MARRQDVAQRGEQPACRERHVVRRHVAFANLPERREHAHHDQDGAECEQPPTQSHVQGDASRRSQSSLHREERQPSMKTTACTWTSAVLAFIAASTGPK